MPHQRGTGDPHGRPEGRFGSVSFNLRFVILPGEIQAFLKIMHIKGKLYELLFVFAAAQCFFKPGFSLIKHFADQIRIFILPIHYQALLFNRYNE